MHNYNTGIRMGFVTIHRAPNGRYDFKGINVIGRDRKGHIANRALWLDHSAPEWFRELCIEYADTDLKVEMKVVKLHSTTVALIMPILKSKDEVVQQYVTRYGRKPTAAETEEQILPETAFDNAFKAHEYVAAFHKLEVMGHVHDGLKSYTRAREPRTGKVYRIVGGMLINKVIKTFSPADHSWQTAVRGFVRRKLEE